MSDRLLKNRNWYRVHRHFVSNLKHSGRTFILESYITFLKNLIDAGYGIIAEEINESESYIETREQLHEWMGLM